MRMVALHTLQIYHHRYTQRQNNNLKWIHKGHNFSNNVLTFVSNPHILYTEDSNAYMHILFTHIYIYVYTISVSTHTQLTHG